MWYLVIVSGCPIVLRIVRSFRFVLGLQIEIQFAYINRSITTACGELEARWYFSQQKVLTN